VAQVERLEQGNDVDAAALEDGTVRDVHLVHRELVELLPDRAGAGQETSAHPIRLGPQAQVEAGRLELVFGDRLEADDVLARDERLQVLAGQDAGRMAALGVVGEGCGRSGIGGGVGRLVDQIGFAHSIALTMSSTTFLASPNTIIVLSM
jgi:hypothetical protein